MNIGNDVGNEKIYNYAIKIGVTEICHIKNI